MFLTRHGIRSVLVKDEQCCGALTHHLGDDRDALARAACQHCSVARPEARARRPATPSSYDIRMRTVIKDYGYLLREDPDFCRRAAQISTLAKDISEYLEARAAVKHAEDGGQDAALSSHITAAVRCRHGQKSTQAPKELLSKSDSW